MSSRRAALALVLSFTGACGGAAPPPAHPDAEVEHAPRHDGLVADVSAEIGALDEDAVNKTFALALDGLQSCLTSGADRVEYLGGSVGFYVKIGQEGRILHAHVEQSTLGDRATEKCMLSVLGGQSWPKPEGGKAGIAHKAFDFDAPGDARPPTSLRGEHVRDAVGKLTEKIGECKAGASGPFGATVYISTEGKALAASVTPPDEAGEAAVDCLVEALLGASYKSPGSWAGKVSFSL